MYRTILVPLSGSSFSELALPTAAAITRAVRAKLVMVRAVSAPIPPDQTPAQAEDEAVREAKRYLFLPRFYVFVYLEVLG